MSQLEDWRDLILNWQFLILVAGIAVIIVPWFVLMARMAGF